MVRGLVDPGAASGCRCGLGQVATVELADQMDLVGVDHRVDPIDQLAVAAAFSAQGLNELQKRDVGFCDCGHFLVLHPLGLPEP